MIDKAAKILQHYVCDNCLGRQFAQLLTGWTNAERGRALRRVLALAIDAGQRLDLEPSNFYDFKFRLNEEFAKLIKKPGKCWICGNLFRKLDKLAARTARQLAKLEFETFLVGTRVSRALLAREEELWEAAGIEHCEPLRAEINREIGKLLERLLRKKAELRKPDIAVLIDMETGKIKLTLNPLYIFGYYKKLSRSIPQSKWEHYKTSVEQIIAKPLMVATLGTAHKIHAAGREDKDVRCLDWRPFVLEILQPKRRKIDFKKAIKQINRSKKILVKLLKPSDMDTVRRLKEASPDKTYLAIVKLDRAVTNLELKALKKLIGTISQRTPERILHRRAELLRKRQVKGLKFRQLKPRLLELKIKSSAGLYIKELITGDKGRTRPSVAEVLGRSAECKQLDVIKIEKIRV
jgi:tRNA pseudouridine synthase 10